MQCIFLIRYPEGYLWDFPGFYAITVPYGKTNDFFFSGHIGCCMINYCEFMAIKWPRMAYFSAITMILQATLMIFLRSHYFIDLVAGIVFAHYFWLMSERFSYIVDVKVFRIPFSKRFPQYTRSCKTCQTPLEFWTDPSSERRYLKAVQIKSPRSKNLNLD